MCQLIRHVEELLSGRQDARWTWHSVKRFERIGRARLAIGYPSTQLQHELRVALAPNQRGTGEACWYWPRFSGTSPACRWRRPPTIVDQPSCLLCAGLRLTLNVSTFAGTSCRALRLRRPSSAVTAVCQAWSCQSWRRHSSSRHKIAARAVPDPDSAEDHACVRLAMQNGSSMACSIKLSYYSLLYNSS